jgi:hypothetical protein
MADQIIRMSRETAIDRILELMPTTGHGLLDVMERAIVVRDVEEREILGWLPNDALTYVFNWLETKKRRGCRGGRAVPHRAEGDDDAEKDDLSLLEL